MGGRQRFQNKVPEPAVVQSQTVVLYPTFAPLTTADFLSIPHPEDEEGALPYSGRRAAGLKYTKYFPGCQTADIP